MKRRIAYGLAVWVLAGFTGLGAQVIRVESQLSSDSMMIGDQIMFTLHVEAQQGVEFRLPELEDTLSRDLEILAPFARDSSFGEGGVTVEHVYLVTGFEPGFQMVPSLPVEYRFGDLYDTARSMPLMLQVFEPEVDTTQQIKPIKPPVNTPLTLAETLPWIGLGVAAWMLGTLVAALVWIRRQQKRDPEVFRIRPLEPAHVVAFRELDRLKEEKLWESGQVKTFYTRLSDISRTYIERQYGIPAMERTTGEILEAFRRSNTGDAILDEMLKELLEQADMVKFARADPLPVENQTQLNNAYLFVQKTFPMFQMEEPEQEQEEKNTEEVAHG